VDVVWLLQESPDLNQSDYNVIKNDIIRWTNRESNMSGPGTTRQAYVEYNQNDPDPQHNGLGDVYMLTFNKTDFIANISLLTVGTNSAELPLTQVAIDFANSNTFALSVPHRSSRQVMVILAIDNPRFQSTAEQSAKTFKQQNYQNQVILVKIGSTSGGNVGTFLTGIADQIVSSTFSSFCNDVLDLRILCLPTAAPSQSPSKNPTPLPP